MIKENVFSKFRSYFSILLFLVVALPFGVIDCSLHKPSPFFSEKPLVLIEEESTTPKITATSTTTSTSTTSTTTTTTIGTIENVKNYFINSISDIRDFISNSTIFLIPEKYRTSTFEYAPWYILPFFFVPLFELRLKGKYKKYYKILLFIYIYLTWPIQARSATTWGINTTSLDLVNCS